MSFSSPKATSVSNRPPALTNPFRYPESASAPVRSKRAWFLLLLTLVLPGSAQILAGNKRVGRLALRITFAVWVLVIAAVVLAVVNREALLNLFTNPWTSLPIIVAMAAAAVGWAIMFLNTLKIIRPSLLAPGMRGLVGGALVVLMVATSGSLGYGALLINSGRNAISSIFQAGPDMDPVDGRYNFLVMGGDAGEDRSGRRPDSIIVVSVDAKSGEAATISIPRNLQNAQFSTGSPLWGVYPEGYNCGDDCIINSLYTDVTNNHADLYPNEQDPGASAMMDAAGGVLGLEIQGYVLIDMAGFATLIDALGGVKVNVGGWVPISGNDVGNGLHLPPTGWISPGVQTLNGYHALWFARSREWATDYARSERQQCIQSAILAQMDPATVLTKFNAIAAAGSKLMESDLPAGQLGSFASLALKAKSHDLARLTIGPPDFSQDMPTYPDFEVIHQRVQELLNPAAPAPAPAPESESVPGETQPDAPAPEVTEAPEVPAAPSPDLTAEYLQQLAINGDDATLGLLLANNGTCSPG
ncbi:Transcriptional regulator, LytR family [Arthrobacter sp. PAMC 25486]|uniref:LCP family protein n=1 Tax=Arthrobacter sp. PAMC 25486 TaxID=1494608 RepID=UPI0005363359|nr:LCP family protein [Arthrobacter sp. PAMC 25486]AIY03558.1 Transcriptional regulator, LytR family [Arthrobacter sp. PAMC 25486]